MADTPNAPATFRQTETWAEKLMWGWLRDRRFSGYKFHGGNIPWVFTIWISFARGQS